MDPFDLRYIPDPWDTDRAGYGSDPFLPNSFISSAALEEASRMAIEMAANPTGPTPRQTPPPPRPAVKSPNPAANGNIANEMAKRLGYVSPDLGAGKFIANKSKSAAAALSAAKPGAGAILGRAGTLASLGAKALPWLGAAAPAIGGAIEGSQDGVGGALVQGGSAAAGSALGATIGSFIAPGLGTVIGAGLGGMVGNGLGGGARGMALDAVNRAQGGDTGLMGQIGRGLDPLFDTQSERMGREAIQQMNSPAMVAIRQQQEQRESAQRAQMAHNLLMQSYARGLG